MTVIGYATLRYSPDALSLLGVRVTLRCGKRRCVSTDPSVATVWFPAILAAVVCTAFWGTTPLCCLFAVVFVPVLISLISLAEVNDGDNQEYGDRGRQYCHGDECTLSVLDLRVLSCQILGKDVLCKVSLCALHSASFFTNPLCAIKPTFPKKILKRARPSNDEPAGRASDQDLEARPRGNGKGSCTDQFFSASSAESVGESWLVSARRLPDLKGKLMRTHKSGAKTDHSFA